MTVFDEQFLQALDDYYFKQIVPGMSPALQSLAVDLRLLRHESEVTLISSFKGIWSPEYVATPWLLNDIFEASEKDLLTLGQAWIALLVVYLTLDHIVDQQVPKDPTVPLIPHFVLLSVAERYGTLFDRNSPFWALYHEKMRQFLNGLALDSFSLDEHKQPFTEEVMRKVAADKVVFFHIAIYAQGLVSHKEQYVAPALATWAAIFLSDQFNDDLLDWEDDLQHGRYTLPLLLAAQAEGDSVEALPGLRQAEIKRRLDKYGILPQMSDKALALLEGAKADLLQLNFGGTRLCAFVDKRLAYTLETKRRLHAATIFNQLANLLTQP